MPTPHINALEEDIAPIVLMPGDPKRSEFIAKNFLVAPRLVNTLRGATAYTGYYKNVRVTIFPSGMGIPSMGIYSHELFDNYGVDLSNTIFDEETLNKSMDNINSSIDINTKIMESAVSLGIDLKSGRVHTSDAFYGVDKSAQNNAIKNECIAVDMETFALLLNAKKFHKRATSVLTISDELYSDKKMSGKEREVKLNSMITLVLESIIKLRK